LELKQNNKDLIKKYFFKLSIPPSVNSLYNSAYRNGKVVFYMNNKAKEAKDVLMMEIKVQAMQNKCPKFKDKTVILEMIPVNMKKGRDTNNLYKLLNDAFQDSGIIDNDKNIIERTLRLEYNNEKESYLKVWLYEAKGLPLDEDIKEYFFWNK